MRQPKHWAGRLAEIASALTRHSYARHRAAHQAA